MYGFGPHTGYRPRSVAEHVAAANAEVHVTIMLESRLAFERLDEIAAVSGIDALTLGPSDRLRIWASSGRPRRPV